MNGSRQLAAEPSITTSGYFTVAGINLNGSEGWNCATTFPA